MTIHQAITKLEKGELSTTDFLQYIESYVSQMNAKQLSNTLQIAELKAQLKKSNNKLDLVYSSMDSQRDTFLRLLGKVAPEVEELMRGVLKN